MADLRLLNPSRPDLSVQYNPFASEDDNYMAQVSMVFGSFNLQNEFFAKHQLNYLADIVRILHYTGKRFNFYDVMVMAFDQAVIEDQVAIARLCMARDPEISTQRRLNFEMSAHSLFQSFGDRERLQKIQGLLNECMTFLDDELSVITGPYDNLLSINDVIDNELILFVSLNINKNAAPVKALGKMMLQNLQLVVGKRYETETERKRRNKPLFSVVMDEFAPFGYSNFAQILNTARGTNTAFLFSCNPFRNCLKSGRGSSRRIVGAGYNDADANARRGDRQVLQAGIFPRSRFRSGRSSCGATISWASNDTTRRWARPSASNSNSAPSIITSRTLAKARWRS
jgi:hypothetical protein